MNAGEVLSYIISMPEPLNEGGAGGGVTVMWMAAFVTAAVPAFVTVTLYEAVSLSFGTSYRNSLCVAPMWAYIVDLSAVRVTTSRGAPWDLVGGGRLPPSVVEERVVGFPSPLSDPWIPRNAPKPMATRRSAIATMTQALDLREMSFA